MAQHVLQVLKEDGRLANKKATVDLKPDQLDHLYRTMVLVRESQTRDPGWSIEEAIKAVISGGIIGPETMK